MPSAVTGGRYEHSVAGRGSPQTEAQSRDSLAPASRLLGPELTLVAEAGGRDGARVRRLPECGAQERR